MKNRFVNIPIFVPHKGCPNDCSFCNQRKITGQSDEIKVDNIKEIINNHLKTLDINKTNIQIAFFGGSFTGIPKEEQISLLEIASEYKKNGLIDGIRISTRPDYINEEILNYLKFYGVTTIELGVQSMKDSVLFANNRGHTSKDTQKAAVLIKEHGFELGLQMMTGLYSDDAEGALYTAQKIIDLKPDCVRIYPTLIIKDTKLEMLYETGKYQPMSLDDTVSLCAKLLQMFEDAKINVLRVGLLGTDNINNDGDVVAGPFHPSIGELSESEMFYNKIIDSIKDKNYQELTISVNPRYTSIAIGHKKKNILKLKESLKLTKIIIKQNNKIPCGAFEIE